MLMIDCRCPKCNRIVRGREEVSLVKSKREYQKVHQCPKCRSAVRLILNNEPISPKTEEYYYTTEGAA